MEKSDRRGDIIGAALELIAKHGFHGAPMARIAEKAGVGAGTIYRYFENKDMLIIEIFRNLEDQIMAVLHKDYPAGRPIRERFLHLGTGLLKYLIEHPLHFHYVEQYHNSPYGVSLRRDRILGKSTDPDIFKQLFEDGITQQVLKELPLFVLFALAFGPLLTLARDHILGFVVADRALIERVVTACWEGIRR
jgi:AcrR family transcriptional regulator